MRKTPRGAKLAALLSAGALTIAACGSDAEDTTTEDTATETTVATEDTEAATEDTEAATEDTAAVEEEEAAEAAMRITYDINPDAVWDDGTPITAADFACTYDATMGSVGSLSTAGYDQIISVSPGESDAQVVIDFSTVYAPYKGLFGSLIKADAVADCSDISGDFGTELPFSGRAMKLESWSPEQSIFVPNENYWGDDTATVSKVVMVPKADADTEIASIKAGEIDFVYPQFFTGLTEAIADPNIKASINFGGDYEALYFQSNEGPFADPDFRAAFSYSIDRDALFAQIYSTFVEGATLLNCGPIVPGAYCDNAWTETYDPAMAEEILTAAGWAKDGAGMWAKDGVVPEIRWMVNAGNPRRENTQAYLIPLLAQAGFNVIADNCEAECVFQQRLPSMDYDLAMYISTAPPDPQYLTSSFTCDQIPTEENEFAGQNSSGWCNEEATAALYEADATVDDAARAELIKQAIALMEEDKILLPLFQFPKSGFYRTDRIGGPVEDELNNYQAFRNFHQWEDVDGDGQIIIGAEQWPGCLNPITECANSSWYVWTVMFPLLPGVYDTTNDGGYALTNLMASEPVVEVLAAG